MDNFKTQEKNFSFANIFNEGFNLFFHNIKKISAPSFFYSLMLVFIFYIPVLFIMVNRDYFDNLTNSQGSTSYTVFSFIMTIVYLIMIMVILAANTLLGITATVRSSELYLKREPTPLKELIKKEKKLILPFVALHLLLSTMITFGSYFFIIPGVLFYLGFFLTVPIFVLEKKSLLDSLKRSWNLTKEKRMNILFIQILSTLILEAASLFIMLIPFIIFTLIFTAFGLIFEEIYENPDIILKGVSIIYLFMAAPMIFASTFVTSLKYGFINVIYYNIKKDSEGFETEQLADNFLSQPLSNKINEQESLPDQFEKESQKESG